MKYSRALKINKTLNVSWLTRKVCSTDSWASLKDQEKPEVVISCGKMRGQILGYNTFKCPLEILYPHTTLIFIWQLKDQFTCYGHVGDESGNIIQKPKEASNLLFSPWRRNILYGLYLCRVHLNTFITDEETQKLIELTPKVHLFGFNLSLYVFNLSNSF